MSDFRKVTDLFWVSPQIAVADVRAAKALGFEVIVNNRPDGEAFDQPTGADIATAAEAAGMTYVAAPVVGIPGDAAVSAVRAALSGGRKTLAFCRSGTRSIITWAMGQVSDANRDELVRLGLAAGYDLSGVIES